MNRYSNRPRVNPRVLARGAAPQGGLSGADASGAAAPTRERPRANPKRRGGLSGLSAPNGLGAPIKQTGDMTLKVVGASFPQTGRVLVNMEADTAGTPLAACWSFYAALVGQPGGQLIDTHLEPITYGTCYHRWQFSGDLPSGVEEAEVWIWWADDIRGWFEAPPAFEVGVGTEDLQDPPPAFTSDQFPLVSTEQGRERGIYEDETKPTIGAIGDFGEQVGSALKDSLLTLAVVAGGGALLWYGAPMILGSSEGTTVEIEQEGEGADVPPSASEPEGTSTEGSGGESAPEERKPPSAEKILAENRA